MRERLSVTTRAIGGYRIPLFGQPTGDGWYGHEPKIDRRPAVPYRSKHPRVQALWKLQCAIEEWALANTGEEMRHETLILLGQDAGVPVKLVTQIFWAGPEINGFHDEIFRLIEQTEGYIAMNGDAEIEAHILTENELNAA